MAERDPATGQSITDIDHFNFAATHMANEFKPVGPEPKTPTVEQPTQLDRSLATVERLRQLAASRNVGGTAMDLEQTDVWRDLGGGLETHHQTGHLPPLGEVTTRSVWNQGKTGIEVRVGNRRIIVDSDRKPGQGSVSDEVRQAEQTLRQGGGDIITGSSRRH